jgi:DNA mismatch endonuclease (patch repair protein)
MTTNQDIDMRIAVPRFQESNGFSTTLQKSKAMGKIKSKNTKPELLLRKAMWASGLKYRIDVNKLPGRPDIVMRKFKLAIFVDGEFWHGYKWEEKKQKIKANTGFWIPKIERNMQRDRESAKKLYQLGFHVMRFWEHEIRKDLPKVMDTIYQYLHNNDLI